jgi:midasin (ATPase involved in ribosome maturation)
VLPQAMVNGGILLIDEVTATPAHILLVLQSVLERAENPAALWAAGKAHTTFGNSMNGGETIHAHPRFRIIVTDNTNGQGDVTGAFAGTNVMNEATRSRFTMWLHKDYPAEGAWRKMLRNKIGVDSDTAKAIVGVAMDVNKGSAQLGATTVTNNMVINPRDTLAVARLCLRFGDIGIAFKVGCINSMNPGDPDRQFVTDLIKAKLTGI